MGVGYTASGITKSTDDVLRGREDCEDGYTEYDGECYYNDDLSFLTLLIYMNEIEFELHYDIGLTIWQNGRINTLLLEGMAIHEIPNNIQNLDSLVHLSFSDNELEYLPDAIGNLPSLKALFLSNNILVEIPETIGNLTNLEFFHMPGNQLTELPLSISNLSSLISFNIDNNNFTIFPYGLIELNNLQYVYMANNAINNLPSNIGILSALQILSAYTNDISQIPSSIGNLSNLYHFDVTNNDLIAIPETICDIYANLTVFDIGLNYICPPYLECLNEYDMGYQDISECEGCCYEAFIANENCDGGSCYIPQCTENCEWEPMQCSGSTGYCWCVDENGIEIEGTSQPSWEGFPDCEDIDLGSTINIPYDYPSIQEGIDAASDGDTILVHPGTYYGPIDFERKNLVIGSLFLLDADTSFISQTIILGTDSNVSPFVQIDGISEPEVELNGFTFQDISLTFGDEAQSYALINILNASPKIINNHFNNFYIDGQAESAVILCNNSSSLIANNIFSDGMIALNYELTGWILSKNSSLNINNNLMENGYVGFADPAGYVVSVDSENIITDNTFNNVSMGYCTTCAAIVALDGSSCIISNNLILRATGDGYGAIVASESQYVAHNNTLVSNNGGYTNLFSNGIVNNDIIINYPNGWGNPVTLDAYSTLQVSYSNIEGGYEGEGNIDINPLFSDAENDDYSLQSASPCIDAGTADLDGDGIDDIIDFYGLAPDMGAYEYESDLVFGERQDFGEVEYDLINEASGIVASRKNENVFWTHNDSNDSDDQNRIFAFNETGQHLGVYYLNNCSARDWEDIAIGPGPDEGQDYIYVGEIGDNYSQYEIKNIFRFIEPDVESNQSPINETLYNIDIIAFQYPDGNRDAETLMLDPLTKDIIIVSKREEVIHIYNLPFPQNTTGTILFPDLIHTMDFYPNDDSDYSRMIVAGDISRDGTEILVKSIAHIFHFPRYENQTIAEALTNTMTQVEYIEEVQGEGVAWHQDGFGYFTLSEEVANIPCHLYFYPRIIGCIDENADNYNPYALEDDGSCVYEYTLGDVNFDNEINIFDVVLMVSFILGEPTDEYEYSAADINQDGLLNILDIVALINIILGN